MANKGYMIERRISAKDVEALNLTGYAEKDVDGGALVTITDSRTDDTFTIELAEAGVKGEVYMAYNPSVHYIEINGKLVAGGDISIDPRDYTNIKGQPVDIFKLVAGVDRVTLTAGNILSTDLASLAKGDELIPTTGGFFTRTGATVDQVVLEVEKVKTLPFPKAGIGMEHVKAVDCVVKVKTA